MITVYEYQADCFSKATHQLQVCPGVLLEQCVGSGKTLVAMLVVAHSHYNRVVVLTPMRDIRRQFDKWSLDAVCLLSGSTVNLPKIEIRATCKKLVEYFEDTRDPSEPQGVAVVTYNIWREAFKNSLSVGFEGNWGSTLIIIDEGHHAYEKDEPNHFGVLARSINEVRAKGAKTLQLTATAARYDGESVQLKDSLGNLDPRITRGLLEHINEGYAPYLQSRVIKVSTKEGISDKKSIFMPTKEFEAYGFQEIIRDFEAKGRPLTIIRIRCQQEKANQRIRDGLKAAFDSTYKNGEVKTVIHISDDKFKGWKELVEAMNPPKGQPAQPYEVIREIANVIIVHQMVNEGIDLPAFSNMYLWGIPYSMPLLIQLIGRIMRLRVDYETRESKFSGYPEDWQNVSQVVFCTSAMGDVVGRKEGELMHQLGGWLHSLEVGTLMSRLARIDDGLHGKRPRKKPADTQDTKVLSNEVADTYVRDSEAWFREYCESEPLNNFSPLIESKLKTRWAFSQAHEENPDLPSGLLEDQLKNLIECSVALKTGDHTVVQGIKSEEELDRATQELIDSYLQKFIEQVRYRGDSFTQWVLHGSLYKHYTNLGKDTGVLDSEREAVEGAREFMRAEGRCPGFMSSLRSDKVPGKKFGFDRYSKHPWKRIITEDFLASTTLSKAIASARHYWGAFDGTSSPQQQRVTFVKFRVDPRFKANPLVYYYPGVLWIRPSFNWVNSIHFEDLVNLGYWTRRTTHATHYDENLEALNLIDAYIRDKGVDSIISLVRSNELDSILGGTENEAA